MKHFVFSLLTVMAGVFFSCLRTAAESVTYRIVDYNSDAAAFTLSACGMRPVGGYAMFDNDFGATRGNRYNQIPRNREATLWLEGWQGCIIESVTLYMCSNNGSGTAGLCVQAGETVLFDMRPAEFCAPEWFGHWVSKDLHAYVAIEKEMALMAPVGEEGEVAITVKGGTAEGSVYLDAVTIDYVPSTLGTESPLGWVFEKLEAKSVLADGDVVMMYRSGDAAGDIDGMAQSHYLDAIGLASTANVTEPFVTCFVANVTADGHWTLTSMQGEKLGATAAQALAWDAGTTTWDITLGYSGATIASTNTKYGTMRYNAPAGSYARFWNYTSNSLPLPYLYRRVRQVAPVVSKQLAFEGEVFAVDMAEQDTLMLHATLQPANVTDGRILWSSADEDVATVSSGIVFPHAVGETMITATAADGGAQATCRVVVTDGGAGVKSIACDGRSAGNACYDLSGRRVKDGSRGVTIKARKELR